LIIFNPKKDGYLTDNKIDLICKFYEVIITQELRRDVDGDVCCKAKFKEITIKIQHC
jgi:hypothetical protein